MNSNTGIIDSLNNFKKEEEENLVPFDLDEIVYLKNCKFRIRSVHPNPQNFIALEGISRKNESEDEIIQEIAHYIRNAYKQFKKLSSEGKEKYQMELEKIEKEIAG